MRSQRRVLWSGVVLLAAGLVLVVPVAQVQGQLQNHYSCENDDPSNTPQVTCGEYCGSRWIMVNGEPQLQLICKASPIEDPGWEDCKVELNEEGQQECSVGEKINSCSVA